jgi:ABC-type multidrug transport system fused ATPase/permease subunit
LLQLHKGLEKICKWPSRETTREFSTIQKLGRVQSNAVMVNARVFRVVNSLWAPGLLFLGGYGLLFSMSFGLGMVVTAVLVVLLCAQTVVSFKSARNSSRWEKSSHKTFVFLREDLKHRLENSAKADSEDTLKRTLKNFLSLLQGRLLATVYSQLLVSIGMISALSIVFLYFQFEGGALLLQESLPSVLAVLVIMIRIFMSLRGLASRVTTINRFYPQLNRYSRLRQILNYAADSGGAHTGDVQSTTILTDLPDNKLNRLRWQSILFGGRDVDFDGAGKGLRVNILDQTGVDRVQDEYVWIDFEQMKNEPPILCRAGDAAPVIKRFKVNKKEKGQDSDFEDEDDMG